MGSRTRPPQGTCLPFILYKVSLQIAHVSVCMCMCICVCVRGGGRSWGLEHGWGGDSATPPPTHTLTPSLRSQSVHRGTQREPVPSPPPRPFFLSSMNSSVFAVTPTNPHPQNPDNTMQLVAPRSFLGPSLSLHLYLCPLCRHFSRRLFPLHSQSALSLYLRGQPCSEHPHPRVLHQSSIFPSVYPSSLGSSDKNCCDELPVREAL